MTTNPEHMFPAFQLDDPCPPKQVRQEVCYIQESLKSQQDLYQGPNSVLAHVQY